MEEEGWESSHSVSISSFNLPFYTGTSDSALSGEKILQSSFGGVGSGGQLKKGKVTWRSNCS